MEAVAVVIGIVWSVTYYFMEVRPLKNRLKNHRHVIFIR